MKPYRRIASLGLLAGLALAAAALAAPAQAQPAGYPQTGQA